MPERIKERSVRGLVVQQVARYDARYGMTKSAVKYHRTLLFLMKITN